MATSTLSIASSTTIGGIVTAYVALPSGQPSVTECSTELYAGGDDGSSQALAFDPFYKKFVVTDAPNCLADAVTSWWWQATTQNSIVTSLGPTFVCPPLYYGKSVLLESGTTEIFCCPTSYTMQSTTLDVVPAWASQCYSRVGSSSLLIYTSSDNSPWVEVSKSIDDQYLIWAPHVNGINVEHVVTTPLSTSTTTSQTTASLSTTSDPSSPTTTPPTSSSNTATNTATSSPQKAKSGLSSGAAAGIGVVATLLVIAFTMVAFFFWKRRKAAALSNGEGTGMMGHYAEKEAGTPGVPWSPGMNGRSELEAREAAQEMASQERSYELPAR